MNVRIKIYLDRLANSPKRPNSYLFSGSSETGKVEAAIYFVSELAGKAGDGEFLRKIKENIHPDIVIVEPEIIEDKKGRVREKEIIIEQIREMRERLKFFPYELERKFCVIKKAHRMNAEASNALLKILEEPTISTFFILLANDAESVLPTIASRCAILRFTETELPKWREENREILKKIYKGEIFEKFDYIEKVSKDKNEMLAVLSDWEAIAAESLRKLVSQGKADARIRKIADLVDKIREAINQLERTNASPRAVGENLVLGMSLQTTN